MNETTKGDSRRPYSYKELSFIKRLRNYCKPAEIAFLISLYYPPGRSESSINRILSLEKKRGASFPKLRHGNLKYDMEKAREWRNKLKMNMNYRDIEREEHVNHAVICRTLCAEIRGELRW